MSEKQVLLKGKIPPQALDMEKLVLGTLLQFQKSIYEISQILFPDAFYKDAHQNIYKAIHTLFLENNPVDLITVSGKLRELGLLERVGGDHYLVGLTQTIFTSANIEYHARIILQKYIARQLIKMHSEGIENAYSEDADVFDLLDDAYTSIASVSEKTMEETEVEFLKTVDEEITHARNIYEKKVEPGILSPIDKINKISGGWRNSELIILAARPSMGKTSLALNFVTACALSGKSVAFYSLEMSRAQLVKKIMAAISKIEGDKWSKYGISRDEEITVRSYKDAWNRINKNLHIDDTASLSIEKLKIKAKVAFRKNKIKMIFIDYLQLMKGNTRSNRNREQEISSISRGLKEIAKDLNIPVMALSQLSRAVETRGGSKRPGLADLRESGAIEQDADVVAFLYRPEYYKIDEWDDEQRGPTAGQAELIFGKNRNGALGDARMSFSPSISLFENLDEDEYRVPQPQGAVKVVPDYDQYLGESNDKEDVPF